jgi:hypothetical protein
MIINVPDVWKETVTFTLVQMGEKMSVESVKRKYEDWLMGLPNVTGVAISEQGGKKVIKVFVSGKVPQSSLKPEEVIPKTLDGFEVDVEEMGGITLQM